jgi:hypothetical protein
MDRLNVYNINNKFCIIMRENRLNFDEFLTSIKENYGEQVILNAVQSFIDDDILFEGQYPFLNDPTMRERNFGVQMKILKAYGYTDTDKVLLRGVEVPGEGWMHCFYRFGNRFEKPEEIEQEIIRFYSDRNQSY